MRVRLELSVGNEDEARRLAGDLSQRFVHLHPQPGDSWTSARVAVISDADAQREQVTLAAARYFWKEDR